MNINNLVLDYIIYKQFNWYDHMQRMSEVRLPEKNVEWCPSGRGKENLEIPEFRN